MRFKGACFYGNELLIAEGDEVTVVSEVYTNRYYDEGEFVGDLSEGMLDTIHALVTGNVVKLTVSKHKSKGHTSYKYYGKVCGKTLAAKPIECPWLPTAASRASR